MEKVVFLTSTPSKSFFLLPEPVTTFTNLRALNNSDATMVLVHENFLRKHASFKVKEDQPRAYLAYCPKPTPASVTKIRKAGFVDYIKDSDTEADIALKMKRALRIVEANVRIANLERALNQKNRKIEQMTLLDPLLGCFNWHYFMRRSYQELSRARRHLFNLSFLAIDIDYFRQINEVYGHKIADFILKELVKVLGKCLRKEDILTRWREDEFFIIAPYLAHSDINKVARRMMDKISTHRFTYKNLKLSIKVSIAAVSFPEDKLLNTKDVISALTDCLAKAKKQGGGAISFYSKSRPSEITQDKEVSVDELKKKIDKLNTLLTRDILEMIYGFAKAIEAKDSYTAKHVEYTALIAEKIAHELKLPESEVENIMRAAILHDLGKVGISENILGKEGALTDQEREIIKSHPWIAAEILKEIHSLRNAIPAILYHHERYDGKGYPLGLKGEEIPLGARIVAVADVYQALISNRPYRKAFTAKKASNIIKEEAGRQFDPKIAKLFLRIIKRINIKKIA